MTLVLSGGLLAGCHSSGAADSTDVMITVSRGSCGDTWQAPTTAPATFQVHNVGTVTVDVDLVDPADGAVYGEIEALGPRTTRPLRLQLGRASYAWRCYGEDTDAVSGPTVTLTTDNPAAAKAVRPVSSQDLVKTVESYRTYVSGGLSALSNDVTTLTARLRSGDLATARTDWLTTHLAYERLGAAYATFGDASDQIDGLPASPGDPDFVGLRRIEYGLWHGEAAKSLADVSAQLGTTVQALRDSFAGEQTDPNDLPLRAHEILENAAQFELTAAADQGSGTGLATVNANLDGTQAVLDALAPVMAPRYAGWDKVTQWMGRLRALVNSQHRPDGSWTPVVAVAPADRQRLNAAMGALLEALAPIAAIGDVRRTM